MGSTKNGRGDPTSRAGFERHGTIAFDLYVMVATIHVTGPTVERGNVDVADWLVIVPSRYRDDAVRAFDATIEKHRGELNVPGTTARFILDLHDWIGEHVAPRG